MSAISWRVVHAPSEAVGAHACALSAIGRRDLSAGPARRDRAARSFSPVNIRKLLVAPCRSLPSDYSMHMRQGRSKKQSANLQTQGTSKGLGASPLAHPSQGGGGQAVCSVHRQVGVWCMLNEGAIGIIALSCGFVSRDRRVRSERGQSSPPAPHRCVCRAETVGAANPPNELLFALAVRTRRYAYACLYLLHIHILTDKLLIGPSMKWGKPNPSLPD